MSHLRGVATRLIPMLAALAIAASGAAFARAGVEEPRAGRDPVAPVATVGQPSVISRAEWGADESLRFDDYGIELWPPTFFPVQKLIVHHTAGTNDDPDPAATVRGIYYHHTVLRGWGDIGYNFLIDESGRIYEGRYSRAYAPGEVPKGEDESGNSVRGAHVANYNAGTVGIALLGTLTEDHATPAALAALVDLLAWKADRHGIDPLGSGVYISLETGFQKANPNISGHRDWAATECPGEHFHSTLPDLRAAVADAMDGPDEPTVPGAPVLEAFGPRRGAGIRLTWQLPWDGGLPVVEYRILRLKGDRLLRIATVGPGQTSYRDLTTTSGRSYTYAVRAVNALGRGAPSNQASAISR